MADEHQPQRLNTPRDVLALRWCLRRADTRCAEWCDTCRAMADHDIAALSHDGFAVVPREPTPAMVRAALDRPPIADQPTLYHSIWRAMVAAAHEAHADA